MRIEELEKGQQEIQEKISQMMEMVTDLTKEKGVIENPDSQDRIASRKNNNGQFVVPNSNDLCEQEQLRKICLDDQNTSMCKRDAISWTRS